MRIACPSLSSWSEKGAVIVTPSRLLASVATQQFTRERLDQRLETWERPAVYHVDAWLSRLWHEARYRSPEVATLLSPDQERVLWQEIIEQKHSKLFDAAGTARLASEAARLLADWQIPLEADAWGNQEDARHFQYWYKLFRRRCREEKWITRADLLRLVPNWIATGFCSRELMILAGFLSFSPAIERVKQTLGLFAVVETVPEPAVTRPGLGVRCHEFADEIEQAARWSRALFEANHAVSIGIFVPELPAQSRLVERCFDAVFYPSAAVRMSAGGFDGNSGMYQRGSVFHIAASRPLSEHPLVSSALLLLELGHSRIAIADAGAILRCPFIIGAESERSARALADIELRKRRDLDVSLADMEFSARECVLLKPVWRRLRSLLSKTPEHLDLPGWSERFQNLLGAIGWPGDRQLTDDEQEVTEKWSEALSRLASLGLVSRTASYSTAVAHLQRILATRGSERGDWLSPIQILDSSNSVGLEFDRAWLAGLSNETWPPQSAPHPLVPLTLQRASHVPGSSFGHVRLERERATKSLFCVAPTVVASYSEQLSAIVEPLIVRDGQLLQWTGKLPRDSYPTINLLETEDSAAPRYRATEPARGGTSIVKAQSQCPFRAFAEFRLNAQRPEDACFGFDARDRGGFLHKALQHVWRQLGSQDCLRSTDADDLRDIIRNAVALAVKEDASSPFHELITITERERLEELIFVWLQLEYARKQPFTVETLEEERSYTLAGLPLRLRVDRMDRLRNGKVLLIDYKSGKQSRNKLECPRPAEPQLWVYAAAVGKRVDGVLFGEIKARELRAVGFSREKHFASSSVTVKGATWDEFLANSTEEVERIAAGFVQGHAAVDPIPGACEYCCVKPFCRVNEQQAPKQDSE